MAITLITGAPGCGKTLRAVDLCMHYLQREPDRPIYSNITGFKRTLPLPDDWRDTPDGSIIVIDEVQQVWPAHSSSKQAPEPAMALDTHRHTGHDFILLTQHPRLLSHIVRSFIQVHEHLTRKGGMQLAFGHRWEGRCAENPPKEWKSPDVEPFTYRYPKHLFKEYQSATVHTVKFKMPRAFKMALLVIPAAIGSVVYATQTVKENLTGGLSPGQQDQAIEAAATSEPVTIQPPSNTVMATGGIKEGTKKCMLIGEDGRILKTRKTDCLNALEVGLPTRVEVLL